MLKDALRSYQHPADRVVVVATQPDPLEREDLTGLADHVLLHDGVEQHISRWWNQGIDYVRERNSLGRYEIYAPSSDVTGTPASIALLRDFMRSHDLTMVGPDFWADERYRIFRGGENRTVGTRVPGGCWMLAGESNLRVDTQFRWWYSDDDLETQARHLRGAGVVSRTGLVPGADSTLSEEKQVWAQEDRVKFVEKWGHEPW